MCAIMHRQSIAKVFLRRRFILMDVSKQITLDACVEDVGPFRAGHTELLVLVV